MITERRNAERVDVFFMVDFRPHNMTHAYSAGIASNLSQEGFNFESQDFKLKSRKNLEFTLKRPDSEWSLNTVGTIVWRRDGWYKCVRGIKITNVDEENRQKILDAVSLERSKSGEPSVDELGSMNVKGNEESSDSHEVVNISEVVERAGSKETVDNVIQKLMSDDGGERDKKEWYHALFQQSADCMLLMEVKPDEIPVIIDANESACSMHGYKREELIGKPVSFLEAPGSRKYDHDTVKKLLEGDALKFETIHLHKDIITFPVLESAQLINIGGTSYIMAVDRETPSTRKNEELLAERSNELTRINEHLYSEVSEQEWIEKSLEDSDRRDRTLLDTVHSGATVDETLQNGIDEKLHMAKGESRIKDINMEDIPFANMIGSSNENLHQDINERVLYRTWSVASYTGRQRRHIIPVLVVFIVALLVTMAISFNDEEHYIAGQGDLKKQEVFPSESLYTGGILHGILSVTINESDMFDITRIKLPSPEPEIHQPVKQKKSKPHRIKKIVRRRSPPPKTVFNKKTTRKDLSLVNAGPQKKDVISDTLSDNKFDNWNTYDNGQASALLEGGEYSNTQEEIRCDTGHQQSFKSQGKHLPFMTHQRCK